MTAEDLIEATAEYVKRQMLGESSGHDWWHVYRVWQMAIRIARETNADMTVVELAALLHDIADWKFHDGDTEVGARVAREWLVSCDADRDIIDRVCEIVGGVSFEGAGVRDNHMSLEADIVKDADRLDAIGAIGIGRTFAFGGANGREMYNPEIPPEFHDSFERYKQNASPTINHFYEKLLLLKDRMNTPCAKRIAEERHRYMEGFVTQFRSEWDGDL
jgi:uncharacterized protein